MADLTEEIEALVSRRIREGFDGFEEIVGSSVEELADEHPDIDFEPFVRAAAKAAWSRAREEQASWPVPTDCDRLDRAFAALERAGVVARQNFTCCQTCGHAEIGDEIAQALTKAEAVGYTFYHMQDTERAAEGGGLFLAYGSLERTEAAQQKVGWTIVEALRREGLAAEWNGDVGKRIEVKNLLWRRRRKFTCRPGRIEPNPGEQVAKSPLTLSSPRGERGTLRNVAEENSGVPSPLGERDRVRGDFATCSPGFGIAPADREALI